MRNRHIFNPPALWDSIQYLQLVYITREVQTKPRDIILGSLSHKTGGIINIDITILVDNSEV